MSVDIVTRLGEGDDVEGNVDMAESERGTDDGELIDEAHPLSSGLSHGSGKGKGFLVV